MSGDAISDEQAIATVRRAYAKQILAVADAEDDRHLEDAFATVAREKFLGSPPWNLAARGGYRILSSSEPAIVYQDVNFALAPEYGINNGSPSLHANWLHRAAMKEGDQVAHIGAGTGYYTALIACLVGSQGHVLAVEFDPRLARLAAANLAHLPNVTVVRGDGAEWPREKVDCVYVNFSVQRPAAAWIDNLKPGGRLIFPLGVPRSAPCPSGGIHALRGAGLCIERHETDFAAHWLGAAFFVCAEGNLAMDKGDGERLKVAFENGGVEFVRSLRWKRPASPDRCWFIGTDWSLSYDECSRQHR